MLHVPTFLAGSFDIGRCSVVLELRCHDGRRYSDPENKSTNLTRYNGRNRYEVQRVF